MTPLLFVQTCIYSETSSLKSCLLGIFQRLQIPAKCKLLIFTRSSQCPEPVESRRGQKGLSCLWWNINWWAERWSHSSSFLHNTFIKPKTIVSVVLQLACPRPDRLKEGGCSHAGKKAGGPQARQGANAPPRTLDGMVRGKSNCRKELA